MSLESCALVGTPSRRQGAREGCGCERRNPIAEGCAMVRAIWGEGGSGRDDGRRLGDSDQERKR
eukprot:2522154-Pleurochrysis_carterae.AAC.1